MLPAMRSIRTGETEVSAGQNQRDFPTKKNPLIKTGQCWSAIEKGFAKKSRPLFHDEIHDRDHRLSVAASLLSSDKPITEVAYSCGFSSSSYFAKLFQSKYGMTPQKYRAAKKEK